MTDKNSATNRALGRAFARGLFLILAISPAVAAQVGFESLVKDINDVNFFFTCWKASGDQVKSSGCPSSKNGYGIEVSFEVARFGIGDRTTPHKRQLTPTTTKVHYARDGSVADSTVEYSVVKEHDDPDDFIEAEFALGYSQFSGFGSSDPSFELRGSARETPSVSLYFTRASNDRKSAFYRAKPYLGVRSGLIQLNNASILDHTKSDTLTSYSGSATAFQLGGVLGLAVTVHDRINFFVEGAEQIRRFANVQWAATGSNKIRDAFPRSLSFGGFSLATGLQFTLRKPNL